MTAVEPVAPTRRHGLLTLTLIATILSIGITSVGLSGVAEATTNRVCSTSTAYPGCTRAEAWGAIPMFTARVRGENYPAGRLVHVRITVYEVLYTGQWVQVWWDQATYVASSSGTTPWLSTTIDCRYNIIVRGWTWYDSTTGWSQQPRAQAFAP